MNYTLFFKKNGFVYAFLKLFYWSLVRDLILIYENPARYIVEKKIFPKICGKNVLIVGCASYSAHYPRLLNKNNVWSIDIDPSVRQYGAKNHIIGDISKATKYFERNFFDFILFGGIFGYGLNTKSVAETTMNQLISIMKRNADLIIWWSDSIGRNSVVPNQLAGYALFKQSTWFGLHSGYRTKQNVIFEFLKK